MRTDNFRYANNGSAVEVTKLCYTEATRNLDFRITCADVEDLKDCVRIIKQYNNFDSDVVNAEIDDKLPSSGISVSIGREGSPVIYIKYLFNKVSKNEMGAVIKVLADNTQADEFDLLPSGEWRLWWD